MRSEVTKLIENDEKISLTEITAVAPMYGDDRSDNLPVFSLLSHLIETAQKNFMPHRSIIRR